MILSLLSLSRSLSGKAQLNQYSISQICEFVAHIFTSYISKICSIQSKVFSCLHTNRVNSLRLLACLCSHRDVFISTKSNAIGEYTFVLGILKERCIDILWRCLQKKWSNFIYDDVFLSLSVGAPQGHLIHHDGSNGTNLAHISKQICTSIPSAFGLHSNQNPWLQRQK